MWSVGNRSEDELIAPLNDFGNRWQGKDFYNALGQLWCSNGKKVVDVSEWEPGIDWQRVRNSGVDGAILRIGLGGGSGKGREDYQFASNLSGVRSVNMPYGVYLYSYAYDADFARKEANFTADLLDKYNCHDLSLPIYYDIEKFDSRSGHSAPSSAAQYEQIIRTYIDTMAARGYTNVEVYTGRAYLQERLNTSYIWSKVSWIAEYGSSLKVTNNLYNGQKGWQYTDSGRVDGIDYDVDLSAFTGFGGVNVTGLSPVSLADGDYYINAVGNGNEGIDIACGSKDSGTRIQLFHANGTAAQKFHFARQSDGSYVITNVNSGLALDDSGANLSAGANVWLYDKNDSSAQRWEISQDQIGLVTIRNELSGKVLDVNCGNAANGVNIQLWDSNGSSAQKWIPLLNGDGTVTFKSAIDDNFALDLVGASTARGTNVQLYRANNTPAQSFVLARAPAVLTEGRYTISSGLNGGMLLDVLAGSRSDGANVQLYQRNGTSAQSWDVKPDQGGGFCIANVGSGKALDVCGAGSAPGTNVWQYGANGSAAQRWIPLKNEDGSVVLRSALAPNLVLDVFAGSAVNGSNVQLYTQNGTAAQCFVFKPIK